MEHLDVSLRNPKMNREFWTEFLDIYRSQHCLWNYKSKAYLNKTLRQRGYEQLLAFLRRGMPDASIETVKSKINTFRTNYRKQMKKLTASRLSSANGQCDEYEPTLWYFNCLRFLSEPDADADANTNGNGINININSNGTCNGNDNGIDICNGNGICNCNGNCNCSEAHATHATDAADASDVDDFTPQQLVEIVVKADEDYPEEEERMGLVEVRSRCSTPTSHVSKASDELRPAPVKRRRAEEPRPGQASVSGIAVDAADSSASASNANLSSERYNPDECELIGKIWATKIRKLPEHVRPYVEKQINDIFFNVTVAINSGRSYPPEHSSTQTEFGGRL